MLPLLFPDRSRHSWDPSFPANSLQDWIQCTCCFLPTGSLTPAEWRQLVPPLTGPGAPPLHSDPRDGTPPCQRHLICVLLQFILLTAAPHGRRDLGEHLRTAPLQPNRGAIADLEPHPHPGSGRQNGHKDIDTTGWGISVVRVLVLTAPQ